jgi:hypothetical protein
MKIIVFTGLAPAAVLLLTGAASGANPDAPRPVDLVVHDAQILTLDARDTRATAMAVEGERIVAVGDESLLRRYTAERRLDLDGRTVMPGFVDSHIHISGRPHWYIPLENVTSIAEIRELVAGKAEELGPGKWITGYGWSEDALEERRRPLIGDLDEAAPENPVVLTRAGGHSAVASSLAFGLARIDASTPDPERGVIEHDDRGRLNGIIRERQDLLLALVPKPDPEALRPSLIENLQALFANGITSIVQASDSIEHFGEWEAVYAEHRGRLPRAAVQVAWEGRAAMQAFGRRTGDGDHHLRIGAIKIFADGGFTGPAAYTKAPYKGHADYHGKLNMSPNELHRIIREAHQAGWQLGIHAIGDAAIELTVAGLAAALEADPRRDHRHYLNHFTMMPSAATMGTMAEHGIGITQQPNFTYTLEGRYVDNLDDQRVATINPIRTPMQHGIHVAISSDILPIGPPVGLYAAVTRRGMSGRVLGPAERIGMTEALRGYTAAGAWLTREENEKGTLEPGKLADFIVLSTDPLTLSGDEILNLLVLETWLGGERVFTTTR